MHALGSCPGKGRGTCSTFCQIKALAAKQAQAAREEREKFMDREHARRHKEAKDDEPAD